MAQLDKIDSTDKHQWEKTITQTEQSNKYQFSTNGKYVDRNIEFTVTAVDGELILKDDITSNKATFSDTNNSGIKFTTNLTDGSEGTWTPGWIDSLEDVDFINPSTPYLESVTLDNGKKLIVHDSLWDWTWEIDSEGNVIIY